MLINYYINVNKFTGDRHTTVCAPYDNSVLNQSSCHFFACFNDHIVASLCSSDGGFCYGPSLLTMFEEMNVIKKNNDVCVDEPNSLCTLLTVTVVTKGCRKFSVTESCTPGSSCGGQLVITSGQPSGMPTCQPTGQPTSQPTSQLTGKSTVKPSLEPKSANPSLLPIHTKPTVRPLTRIPTSFDTKMASKKMQVSILGNMKITNVTSLAIDGIGESFKYAIINLTLPNLMPSNIIINSKIIYTANVRRHLSQSVDVEISFTVNFVLQTISLTLNISLAGNLFSSSLSLSILNGDFCSAMIKHDPTLNGIAVNFHDLFVSVPFLNSTEYPTNTPSQFPSKVVATKITYKAGFYIGINDILHVIFGIALGFISFLFCFFCLKKWYQRGAMNRRKVYVSAVKLPEDEVVLSSHEDFSYQLTAGE